MGQTARLDKSNCLRSAWIHFPKITLELHLSLLPLASWQVCLVNDPRPQNPYCQLYTVEYLGNMAGGRKTLYNNQPIDVLKKLAATSIKDGEVWVFFW